MVQSYEKNQKERRKEQEKLLVKQKNVEWDRLMPTSCLFAILIRQVSAWAARRTTLPFILRWINLLTY